jgi:hypothetical protein
VIFRSNLTCPDLMPRFKHLVSRPMPHSFGHDVPSDWGDKSDDDPLFGQFKQCGMWTHDEAAILSFVAAGFRWEDDGNWIDVGAHTGWTSQHIHLETKRTDKILCVDPMLKVEAFRNRFKENWCSALPAPWVIDWNYSDQLFGKLPENYKVSGFCIDGCHEDGQPQRDALNAAFHLKQTGVIMFHDGVGRPVREAVQLLMQQGFKARAYFTPYLVFCCWRGHFTPPDHSGDPLVKAAHLDGRYPDFDFEAMS